LFFKKAKRSMKIGYDLIGDSILPAKGFFIFNFLEMFIDFEKIEEIKQKQVKFYENNIVTDVPYSEDDKSKLMAYPIVLPIKIANQTLKRIRDMGLLLDFELNDSKWSKKHKIIYLPLGPHISNANLQEIIEKVSLI